MEIVWYDVNGISHYVVAYGTGANGNGLSESTDVQDSTEFNSNQVTAAKSFLHNKRGISNDFIHSGTKPPH